MQIMQELYVGVSEAGWGVYCGCESLALDLDERAARTVCALINTTLRSLTREQTWLAARTEGTARHGLLPQLNLPVGGGQ